MSYYDDYDRAPRGGGGGGGGRSQQQYYDRRDDRRDDPRYADDRDAYYRPTGRDVMLRPHQGSELSVEEVHRDFPPPGYGRNDIRRARSAGGYDDYYDNRASNRAAPRGSRDDHYYDDGYDGRRRSGTGRKAESVYIEEEERKRKRMLSNQEKIFAAIAGAAVVLGGKEVFDRREAQQEGGEVRRNALQSAALGAAGAFAGYSGADLYNKQASKAETRSTHIVHKGRDGKVAEWFSDDEDEKEKKGSKNFLEGALAAAGLGGALKALTGGGDEKDEKDGNRDRDRDNRSRRGSRSSSRETTRSKAKGKQGVGSKVQKAAMASLIAGATEAFRVAREPGGWKGEKAKRVFTAAAGAATIDAAQGPDKDGSKLGIAEAVIGGLIGNRLVNGSKRDIIEDKNTGRSQSRSRARSKSRGAGAGLAGLAAAGLGAIGAKRLVDSNKDSSRSPSRSRRRSISYDSRDGSPDRRKRSRSVVDRARDGLAKLGIGKEAAEERRGREYDSDSDGGRGGGGGGRRDRSRGTSPGDDYDTRSRGGGRYNDEYDEEPRRTRGGGTKSTRSRASSASSSDLGDSDDDEKRAKKMRGKQILTTGLAAVATIHAAHNVYSSMEKRNARHRAVREGRLSQAEAQKLKSKALLQDAASVGIAALGIKGALSELKEAREMRHEVLEWKEEKEKRHNKRLERLKRANSKHNGQGSDDGYDDDNDGGYQSRSRADNYITAGPARADRYEDGPRYNDGNPYGALPPPPVGYDDRR